ncbi:hypothetical protein GBA52_006241 [Prunus armeniaca]|nr:hypothetical protein GBA52_006241 [Prunus armeniaca]
MNGLVCLKNRAEEQFLMNEKDLKGRAESADKFSAQPAYASYCTRKHMHRSYILGCSYLQPKADKVWGRGKPFGWAAATFSPKARRLLMLQLPSAQRLVLLFGWAAATFSPKARFAFQLGCSYLQPKADKVWGRGKPFACQRLGGFLC